MTKNIKSRLILIGMFVFFAIPIVVVTIMYQYNWRPRSFSYGELIKPIVKINISNLPKDSIVADIVYKPLFTDLLSQAQSQNNPIVTGMGMLINQALVGFEMWFGVKEVFDQKLNDILLAKL